MAPSFPGISDSPTLESWDPPFPVDLRRIRPQDERYWSRTRTTPKAFVSLQAGQRLWRSRYGALTSVRVRPPNGGSVDRLREDFVPRLRAAIDPLALGLTVSNVRARSLEASRSPISASTSSTSASSWSCRRWCSRRSSSSSVSSSASVKWVCFGRSGLALAGSGGCSSAKRCSCLSPAACLASAARSPMRRSSCWAFVRGGWTPLVRRRSRCTSRPHP